MKLVKCFTLTVIVLLFSGCAAMIPYEDEFACKRSDNMGKCISTEEAYEEMTSGESVAPYAVPASQQEEEQESSAKRETKTVKASTGYESYLDANYRESAQLINQSITPLMTNGALIKVVLVPNKINSTVLLSERTMYVIVEKPDFIMGDYLRKKSIPVLDLFGDK